MSAKTLEIPIRIEITESVIRKIKGLAAITGKESSQIEEEIVNALTERVLVKSEDLEAVLNSKIGLTIGHLSSPNGLKVAESVSEILESSEGLLEASDEVDEIMDPKLENAQEPVNPDAPDQGELIFDDLLDESEEDGAGGVGEYSDPIMADAQRLAETNSGGGGGAVVSDVYDIDSDFADEGPLPADYGMGKVSGDQYANSMGFFNQMMSNPRGGRF